MDGRSRGNVELLERHVRRAYPDLSITPQTAACKWTGERMDYSMAIESMQWHEQQCGAAAPDTS